MTYERAGKISEFGHICILFDIERLVLHDRKIRLVQAVCQNLYMYAYNVYYLTIHTMLFTHTYEHAYMCYEIHFQIFDY